MIPTPNKNITLKIGKAIGAIKEKSPDTSSDTKKKSLPDMSNKVTTATTTMTTPKMSPTTSNSASTGLTNYLNDPVYQSKKSLVEKTYDTAINKANTAYDAGKSKLERAYGTSVDELNRNKKTSEQTASVAREQLKKYLPTMIKAQGLGGLGVSETAALSAYNNYATNMAQISADYNANKTSLDNSYNDSLLSLYTDKNNAITSADLAKAQSLAGLEQYLIEKQASDQNNAYNEALTLISDGYFNDSDELKNYLKSYEGRVNDTQLASLNQMANYYANSDTEKDAKALKEEEAKLKELNGIKHSNVKYSRNTFQTSMEKGDTFYIKDSAGNEIEINSGGEVIDQSILDATAEIDNNEVFGYQQKLYIKNAGKVYLLEPTTGSAGAHNYNLIYDSIYGSKTHKSSSGKTHGGGGGSF